MTVWLYPWFTFWPTPRPTPFTPIALSILSRPFVAFVVGGLSAHPTGVRGMPQTNGGAESPQPGPQAFGPKPSPKSAEARAICTAEAELFGPHDATQSLNINGHGIQEILQAGWQLLEELTTCNRNARLRSLRWCLRFPSRGTRHVKGRPARNGRPTRKGRADPTECVRPRRCSVCKRIARSPLVHRPSQCR